MHLPRRQFTAKAPKSALYRRRLGLTPMRGLSTVEYVIILVLIAAVCVATWTAFGGIIKSWLGVGEMRIDSCLQGNCQDVNGAALTPGGGAEPRPQGQSQPTAKPPKHKEKRE